MERHPDYYFPLGANLAGLDYTTDFGETFVKVPSRSVQGLYYRVKIDNNNGRLMSCWLDPEKGEPCPGWHFRGDCHHIRALLFMVVKKEKKKGGGMDTRLQAYYELLANPEQLEHNEYMVYSFLAEHGPHSFSGIVDGLGWKDRAHVTGRIASLREKQMVEDGGHIIEKGRSVHAWRAIT